jgi:hypothetical protein
MATSQGLLPESGGGSTTTDSAQLNRKYLVLADSFSDEADVICTATGIPALFDVHPTVLSARVRDISAERIGNSLYWVVDVSYKTSENNNDEEENDDPLLDRPRMSIGYEDREEVVLGTLATTRTPQESLANSAGELFDPPPVTTRSNLVLTISKNYEPTYAVLTTALSFMDSINDDTFIGLDPKTCRMMSVSPKSKNRNGTDYLEISFTIKTRPTWDLVLLDYGSYYLDGGDKKEFKTDDGHEDHGKLNGSGAKWESGPDVFLPAKQIYMTKTFGDLDLPNDLTEYIFD